MPRDARAPISLLLLAHSKDRNGWISLLASAPHLSAFLKWD